MGLAYQQSKHSLVVRACLYCLIIAISALSFTFYPLKATSHSASHLAQHQQIATQLVDQDHGHAHIHDSILLDDADERAKLDTKTHHNPADHHHDSPATLAHLASKPYAAPKSWSIAVPHQLRATQPGQPDRPPSA